MLFPRVLGIYCKYKRDGIKKFIEGIPSQNPLLQKLNGSIFIWIIVFFQMLVVIFMRKTTDIELF